MLFDIVVTVLVDLTKFGGVLVRSEEDAIFVIKRCVLCVHYFKFLIGEKYKF